MSRLLRARLGGPEAHPTEGLIDEVGPGARPTALRLYFETVRHLRVRQVWGWASERLARMPAMGEALPVRVRMGAWVEGYLRPASMLPGGRVWLLNQSAVIGDWNSLDRSRLWNYHLHYFEDPRVGPEWFLRWKAENPVGAGAGWEAYPLSRRIVNWIRWLGRQASGGPGDPPNCELDESVAWQARFLASKIEYRLLANHLFVNAKALIYAGTYFSGPEAAGWLATGLKILDREVGEQILGDGGHYERSPMYHALILEDLLDLESLRQAYPGVWAARPLWATAAGRMLGWLRMMTHPDGEIAFFQDACWGVAPSYLALEEYAGRLGVNVGGGPGGPPNRGVVSGYRRLEAGELVVLFDGGGPGPDYQPGHAHAGTLSIEASWAGGRVIVNSGTSTYELSAVRAFERSTEAHATVRVDGRDSSEMWSAFRVARRARVQEVAHGANWVSAMHTGYAPVMHRRRVTVSAHEVLLEDEVTGGGLVEWFFPLHPSIEMRGMELWRAGWRIGRFVAPAGVRAMVEPSEWRPEFNLRVPASRIRMWAGGAGKYETRFVFEGQV